MNDTDGEKLIEKFESTATDEYNIDKELMEILKDMLNTNNIELKTDIPESDVKKLVLLTLYQSLLKKYSKKSADLIGLFINLKFKYALSSKRQSRKEILDVIKSYRQNVMTPMENSEENKKWKFLKWG